MNQFPEKLKKEQILAILVLGGLIALMYALQGYAFAKSQRMGANPVKTNPLKVYVENIKRKMFPPELVPSDADISAMHTQVREILKTGE